MEVQKNMNSSSSDFYSVAYENGPFKTATVVATLISIVIFVLTGYGIIWYEHYGSDKKRILINRLVSSLCWTGIELFVVVIPLEMLRYLIGPMPSALCQFHVIFKNVINMKTALLIDGVSVARYLYIFYLKNPSEFKDDFWHLFINIWVNCFCFVTQYIFIFLPGIQPLNYYLCIGTNPKMEGEALIYKRNLFYNVILLLSVVLYIAVSVKLVFHRVKIDATSASTHKDNFKREIINDVALSAAFFGIASLYVGLFYRLNTIDPAMLNVYPNFIYMYSLHFGFPIITGFIFSLIFYAKNKHLRSTLWEEVIELAGKNKVCKIVSR